jgi:hypothetical protein
MHATQVRRSYPPGSVLALVTWAQREDPHWFGARIPDRPLSVEFVEVSGEQPAYRSFSGNGLASSQNAAQRTKFVLGWLLFRYHERILSECIVRVRLAGRYQASPTKRARTFFTTRGR